MEAIARKLHGIASVPVMEQAAMIRRAAQAAKVAAFESAITPHILRHWSRERIVRFAKHLLGDACQGCEKCEPAPSKESET
jgi:hypothetical protein